MKRRQLLLAGLLAASVLAPASANARPLTAHAATTPTVALRETAVGPILVDASGFTLFEFSKDKKNRDTCTAIVGCTSTWPPLTVTGAPVAGEGVNAKLLGTIILSGGEHQVTYAGRPLYGYSGNAGPGETSYVGVKEFGGTWYAMNAKGKKVKQAKPKKSKASEKSKEGEKPKEGPW